MPSPAAEVAVVIPSWNSAALLPALLDSLAASGEEVELLVVDNGSRDGTLELLRERGVEHVALPTNVGFAAAMNRGVAATSAPFVLGLNADTVVVPGAIGGAGGGARRRPRASAACSRGSCRWRATPSGIRTRRASTAPAWR